MGFGKPLLRGTLVRRYKRFLADVRLQDGRVITVHCANSGAMLTCAEPGRPVIISDSQNDNRKLRYTWEMIRIGRTWVGVHSVLANHWGARFIESGKIPELGGYDELQREVGYGRGKRSRVDLVLRQGRAECYVEIKFGTMRVGDYCAFPDAVSERARKHLEDLVWVKRRGQRAVILFFVGRNDCARFRPADEIDPDYGKALRRAIECGVEPLAYRLRVGPRGVALTGRMEIDLHARRAREAPG